MICGDEGAEGHGFPEETVTTSLPNYFPETVGKPSYDAKRTTWTVRVKLKPDWSYRFMLNSAQFNAFQSGEGVPLEPVEATFKTAKGK